MGSGLSFTGNVDEGRNATASAGFVFCRLLDFWGMAAKFFVGGAGQGRVCECVGSTSSPSCVSSRSSWSRSSGTETPRRCLEGGTIIGLLEEEAVVEAVVKEEEAALLSFI